MIASTLRWNGPRWLSSSDKHLPVRFGPKVGTVPSKVCEEERKIAHGCTAVVREPLIDMSRYGTWLKLIRVTAYVLRAAKFFKIKCKSSESELSAEEVKKAEVKCCKWVQEEVYKEDYQLLKSGQTLPQNSRLLKLDPYYDREDHFVRVGGRLQFSDQPEQTKHQVILPHGDPEVAKMVLDLHKIMLDAGP